MLLTKAASVCQNTKTNSRTENRIVELATESNHRARKLLARTQETKNVNSRLEISSILKRKCEKLYLFLHGHLQLIGSLTVTK